MNFFKSTKHVRIYEYAGPSSRAVQIGDLTLFFSFETLIGVRYLNDKESTTIVRKNSWKSVTGTHLNRIDGGNGVRFDDETFNELVEQTLLSHGLIALDLSFQGDSE